MRRKSHRYPKKRKPYRYRPRILLKRPPFTEDGTLRNISLGIILSEGFPYCRPSDKRLLIGVSMCDKKAVEIVAKAWETRVWRLKQKRCDITPENPEGFPYVTEALGYRAELIMKGYEPEILGTEIYKKWLEKKKECGKNTLIGA